MANKRSVQVSEKTDIFGGAALTAQAAPQQATPKGDEDLGGLPVEAQSLLAAFDRSETVGLCILNRHHRLVHANQTFARLIGRTPDRLVGERLASFLDQESVATAREALNAVSRGEPPGPNTLSLISSQGQPVEMRTEIWFIDGRFGRPYLLMLAHPLPQAPKAPEVEEDDQSTVTISRAEATALINQTVRQAKAAQERLVAPPPPAGPQATSRDRALASGREKMLHAILKSLPDTVFVLDKAARIATVWSPETTIAGHSATRVHGMHIGQLFQPSDTLRLRQAMRLARGRRQARALIVQPARKRPGSDPTYLELRFSDLGPGGTIVIMRDVTVQHHARVMLTGQVENLEGMRRAFVDRGRQLTRLADRLTREKRRSERIKATRTHFLATVSHEFRTPLNAILGFAEILHSELLGPLGNQRYRRYARDILESGNLLLSLVDTVMSYEQAVSERLTLEPDRVELKEVINEVLGLLGRWASSLGISLEVIDPP
ncbi:MAG: PAS domain-containing protein, partial [Pseudomonadota bacterium]